MPAQKPSDKGHHELEQAEVKGQAENLPGSTVLATDAQPHGKGIAAKGHGD
jgi:hypothetical protein